MTKGRGTLETKNKMVFDDLSIERLPKYKGCEWVSVHTPRARLVLRVTKTGLVVIENADKGVRFSDDSW